MSKPSLFGTPSSQTTTNVFGQPQNQTSQASGATSLFGQIQQPQKSLFNTQPTNTFGQPSTQTSLFGQTQQQSSFFTSPVSTVVGTTIKLDPVKATDTMVRNNETKTINTKLMCISAMKQYESKSLEVTLKFLAFLFKIFFRNCEWKII